MVFRPPTLLKIVDLNAWVTMVYHPGGKHLPFVSTLGFVTILMSPIDSNDALTPFINTVSITRPLFSSKTYRLKAGAKTIGSSGHSAGYIGGIIRQIQVKFHMFHIILLLHRVSHGYTCCVPALHMRTLKTTCSRFLGKG